MQWDRTIKNNLPKATVHSRVVQSVSWPSRRDPFGNTPTRSRSQLWSCAIHSGDSNYRYGKFAFPRRRFKVCLIFYALQPYTWFSPPLCIFLMWYWKVCWEVQLCFVVEHFRVFPVSLMWWRFLIFLHLLIMHLKCTPSYEAFKMYTLSLGLQNVLMKC